MSFLEACGVGDTAEMTRQLRRDPKLAATWTEFGWSALHLAAFSGVPGAVQLLLDRGADLHARARSKFKNTPLQAALLAGQLATAKLLLERGADPLVRQARGFTPLHEVALLGRRDLVDLLLGAGAEINSRSDDGRTPVTEALRGKHAELADYLRSKGGRGADITANLEAAPVD
ncbi:MAG TPA: ankyrin repeat domain-containing protein [Kofleriaceae bacterium]|nr:ankyrin repeat domain-containing protein [Kofleriaceae bacterium]